MDVGILVSFLAASMILTVSPGPDILYVITSSSAKGFKTGFTIALGLCSGLIIHATVVAFGAAQFIVSNYWIFLTIKLFGVLYLLWLAYSTYRSSIKIEVEASETKEKGFIRLFSKGFLMNVLNPKVMLFFLAFLPQFIPANTTQPIVDSYVLSGIFFAQALLIFSIMAFFSDKMLGFFRRSEKGLLVLKWVQIFIFVSLSVGILFT